jgi:hypothetical protein
MPRSFIALQPRLCLLAKLTLASSKVIKKPLAALPCTTSLSSRTTVLKLPRTVLTEAQRGNSGLGRKSTQTNLHKFGIRNDSLGLSGIFIARERRPLPAFLARKHGLLTRLRHVFDRSPTSAMVSSGIVDIVPRSPSASDRPPDTHQNSLRPSILFS